MYDPTSYADSPNAISLPESASGPSLYDVLDGPITDQFGQVHARASLSARQVKALGSLTSGTYGLPSNTSSPSATLQSSLESRLQAALSTLGSTLYTLTWKPWVTPSGVSRSRLRASVRRTSETETTGWPTPAVMDTLPPRSDAKLARAQSVAGCSNLKDVLPKPSSDEMERRVRVNPALPRGLMALPPSWDACAPTETPSMLKRLASGSKQ